MNRKYLLIAAATAIGLLLVVIFLVSRDSGTDPSDPVYGPDPSGPRIDPDTTGPGDVPQVSDDPYEVLEAYVEWAKYPPYTRPLHEGQVDLTDPFNPENLNAPVGVISKPAQCEQETDGTLNCTQKAEMSDVVCKLLPESTISVGKSDFKVLLYCYRPGPKQENLSLDSIEPKVYMKHNRKTTGTLPPVAFGDDGQNGDEKKSDGIYTFLVRPTANDWGPMYLEVAFTVDGMKHVQRTNWYSTPQIVAEFTGNPSDRIEAGNLRIQLPLNVFKAGYYIVRANLQEKDGSQRMVAQATWEGELGTGNQTVPLEFFGKVIRDSGVDGPYVVRNIRAHRDNSPVNAAMLRNALETGKEIQPQKHDEPMFEYVRPAENYMTRAYSADEFSDEEWQSEEKDRRINYLKSLTKEE